MESVKDLIVDVSSTEVSIALMENHRLIELNKESSQGHNFSVGDVYLGKVKKLLPALNAAFVDIGDEKEAFVHYLDLGLYFEAFDDLDNDHLSWGEHILYAAVLLEDLTWLDVLVNALCICVRVDSLDEFVKGFKVKSQIKIVDKCLFLISDIDEGSVQGRK